MTGGRQKQTNKKYVKTENRKQKIENKKQKQHLNRLR